jgi:2-polyprenyl-3-methyl-5-hydroxy-6-metoxy-1,4-benzoquinol methylase
MIKSQNNKYYDNVRSDTLDLIKEINFNKVLEIGGGNFKTLKLLARDPKIVCWGIDPIATKSKSAGVKLVKGRIDIMSDANKIPNSYFDLIVANDVIEHIADTKLFFSVINSKINSDGYLLMSVPNVRQIRTLWNIFVMGTFPRSSSGLFDSTHLRWFCKKDIESISFINGFKVVSHKYKGRYVPKYFAKFIFFEFLALQNIFLLKKIK